jgi:predicted nucleic acid-binding protein
LPSVEPALCDSGPLVALFDASDSAHEECRGILRGLQCPLVTTWPALTEAFYFLENLAARELLWDLISGPTVETENVSRSDFSPMRSYMVKYADLPMDFADASLVVIAERLRLRKVFTLDHHFRLYRPRHARSFEVFP